MIQLEDHQVALLEPKEYSDGRKSCPKKRVPFLGSQILVEVMSAPRSQIINWIYFHRGKYRMTLLIGQEYLLSPE